MPHSSGHRPSPCTVDLPKAVTAKATATLSTWVLIIDTAACRAPQGVALRYVHVATMSASLL